jgi:hypothetical protein
MVLLNWFSKSHGNLNRNMMWLIPIGWPKYVHIRKLNNNRVGKNTNSKANYPLENGWVTHMVHKLYIKCPLYIWNGIEHESFYFLPF